MINNLFTFRAIQVFKKFLNFISVYRVEYHVQLVICVFIVPYFKILLYNRLYKFSES